MDSKLRIMWKQTVSSSSSSSSSIVAVPLMESPAKTGGPAILWTLFWHVSTRGLKQVFYPMLNRGTNLGTTRFWGSSQYGCLSLCACVSAIAIWRRCRTWLFRVRGHAASRRPARGRAMVRAGGLPAIARAWLGHEDDNEQSSVAIAVSSL